MAGRTDNDPLLSALAHPLRQEILRRTAGQPTSPTQIATATGEPLGNVSYHVRILAAADLLVLDRTEPRRGAVEHFYRRSRSAPKQIRKAATKLSALADALAR